MPSLSYLEKKTQNPISCLVLNISLIFIILFTAEIGRFFGWKEIIPPVSLIWPPTGFSLAALLLFGFKLWPGIFLGNFLYNFLYNFLHSLSIWGLIIALLISLGSLIEALVAGYIIRKYCSKEYFNTVKDIFIFLIPAGLLACLIAPTLGTLSLYLYGSFSLETTSTIWLTFWIGDFMGVYIFTPLLVTWIVKPPKIPLERYPWEAFFMGFSFIALSFFTIVLAYPLAHLYLPLSLWISYRFRMHGATLGILLLSLATMIPTAFGIGALIATLVSHHLIILVSYVGTIIASSLLLVAIINEREAAWHLIQTHNIDLQQAVEVYMKELKEVQGQSSLKEKFTLSVGLIMSGIARQIRLSLKKVDEFVQENLMIINHLQSNLQMQKGKIESQILLSCEENLNALEKHVSTISKYEVLASRITIIIQEQLALTSPERVKIKVININTLLNTCLIQATSQEALLHPDFTFTLIKEFDKSLPNILGLPGDLISVFQHFFLHAFHSMQGKRKKLGSTYAPVLEVKTFNKYDTIEINIRDDGIGVSEQHLKSFSRSFLDEELPEEVVGLNNALIHDFIVQIHQGNLQIKSKEGEYLLAIITIPKGYKTNVQLLRSAKIQSNRNKMNASL